LKGTSDIAANREDARGEYGKLEGVAAVKREVNHAFGVDNVAEDGVLGVDGGGLSGDLNGFGDGAELEGGVDAEAFVDLKADVFLEEALETVGFDFQLVEAGAQGSEGVLSLAVGGDLAGGVVASVAEGDLGSGDGGAAVPWASTTPEQVNRMPQTIARRLIGFCIVEMSSGISLRSLSAESACVNRIKFCNAET
jgi:hypothetical protein